MRGICFLYLIITVKNNIIGTATIAPADNDSIVRYQFIRIDIKSKKIHL
ncbi:hypothetical protein VCR26J2_460037 [Vibrio coralliirubri]|nr:hypothetical protein VCR26J2_460037 [Vibrio coralliirubri]